MTVDLNCDMGEGIGNDADIFPFITSANIACGYHAGNEQTMSDTIRLAMQHQVAFGAHPSFFDRQNFGRSEPSEVHPQHVYELVVQQVQVLATVAARLGATLHHVKPHGALYNMAARQQPLAAAIARAVFDIDKRLVLYGLSGSYLISEAKAIGLATASEVFADRTYQGDGSLTPRSKPNALIEDEGLAIAQAVKMVKEGRVVTAAGDEIELAAETVCLHGDGKNAAAFARAIHAALEQAGVVLEAM